LDSRGAEIGHSPGHFRSLRQGVADSGSFVDQAEFPALLSVEGTAGERPFERTPFAHGGRDRAKDQKRPQAKADFGETESGIFGSDYDVAIGHQAGAAAERGAVDRSHERFGQARSDGEELLVQNINFGWIAAGGLVKVHTGAEARTMAIKQDGADSGVGIGLFQRLDQRVTKFAIERVAFVRAVERKTQQPAILNRVQNGVQIVTQWIFRSRGRDTMSGGARSSRRLN